MTLGVSIVHFVIKVSRLVQNIIVTIYIVQAYQSFQDGRQKSKMAGTKVKLSDVPQAILINTVESIFNFLVHIEIISAD